MKNFKPGQKVVFRDGPEWINPASIKPKDNAILTIMQGPECSPSGVAHWRTKEYPYDSCGAMQFIGESHLYPLISDAVLEKELASISETQKV